MKNFSKFAPSALLARLFYHLGYHIAKYPKFYILGPIIVALTLSTGCINFIHLKDPELLYTPTNGDTKHEKAIMESFFPDNNTHKFDVSRAIKLKRFARIIIKSKREDNNLISPEAWQEMKFLDSLVHNATIEWKGEKLSYNDMCGRWNDVCYENTFLELANQMKNITKGLTRLSYPIMFNMETLNVYPLAQYFGGVTLKNDSYSVAGVEAILLHYFIGVGNEEQDIMGSKWERALLHQLNQYDSRWKEIEVYRMTFETVQEEVESNLYSVLPTAVMTIGLMIGFTVFSSIQKDCVRSKPWLGFVGVVSALLGTMASFGILLYAGMPFISLNIAVPFIMLGIGVDDTFVMLSAWRCTDHTDSVPKRMAVAYSEAAVSVTITSLTDMFSFYVGVLTPIPSISIFSTFAGTGVLCIYLWHLFFFGAAVAISGYHEEQNRHGWFWWITATPKSKSENKSAFERAFFSGGVDKDDPKNPIDKDGAENLVMVFFRDSFAPMILKPTAKILILLSFVVYLLVSYYGITQMKEGIRREKLVRTDSYLTDLVVENDKYFNTYPYRLQLAITNPLDYSNSSVQEKVKAVLNEFYDNEFFTTEYAENWLQSYTRHLELYKDFVELNVTSEQEFNEYLANEYLTNQPVMAEDVVFNEDNTQIIASRFILQTINIRNPDEEKRAVEAAREMATSMWDKYGINCTIYHPAFHFIDQFIMIRSLTLKLVSIAAVLCLAIAVILIPSLICSICVFFSIVSIQIGVLGFMSLWDVHLDIISIVCLIMCIGFSVDFSAHISYAYISSKDGSELDKIKQTMYSLGYPILQGAVSSILGVALFIFIPSYIFHVFFKIVLLVIVFATYHALVLLPVFLTILNSLASFKLGSLRTRGFTLDHDQNDHDTSIKDIPNPRFTSRIQL